MIKFSIIPAATATQQELLVEIEENLCKPVCVDSSLKPVMTVTFETGPVTVLDENAIVPVKARIMILTPSNCPNGCAHPQVLTESFDVGFPATATNAITLATGDQVKTELTHVKCRKARSIKLTTSLTLSIA